MNNLNRVDKISTDAKKVIISVNPKAGRTSPMLRAEELRDRLNRMGFQAELGTDLEEISEKVAGYQRNGELRVLVGVGGDGTAAELVNRTAPGTPITLLSSGTANLIAKYLRLGRSPKRLAEVIAGGHVLHLDAGRANDRLFLVMIGCGFDAHVVQQVHAYRENRYKSGGKQGAHISYFSYIKPIIKSLLSYRYPRIHIETQDSQVIAAQWVFIFNLPRYGWGIPLVLQSNGTDGRLDHCLFQKGSIINGLKYTVFAQCGAMHRLLPDVKLGQSKKYRITSDSEVFYQLDGDPGGKLPVEVEIIEKRFTVVVPEWAVRRYGTLPHSS
ncbi:MAG: hypothetical protein LBQ54_02740 [Planctomycetaceae bacterium]|jgi:diacylglycerol kinase family enzyme|nr:hypothetical protein [Planctomycetaceae bacterium]